MQTEQAIERATARPWAVSQGREMAIYGQPRFCGGDKCDQRVAVCDDSGLALYGEEAKAEARANAALIVQAVNSYAALVAVAEAAMRVQALSLPDTRNDKPVFNVRASDMAVLESALSALATLAAAKEQR